MWFRCRSQELDLKSCALASLARSALISALASPSAHLHPASFCAFPAEGLFLKHLVSNLHAAKLVMMPKMKSAMMFQPEDHVSTKVAPRLASMPMTPASVFERWA